MSKRTKKSQLKLEGANDLPDLPNVKTKWDLEALYYKNADDPRIEADVSAAEHAYGVFAKRWAKHDFNQDQSKLLKALQEYEALNGRAEFSRPGRYFSFRKCLDVNDKAAERQLALLSDRLRKASDQILFFGLNLGKLPSRIKLKILKDKKLIHFHYFLKRVFESAEHDLSEAEEKIVRLKARQASGMWHEAVEKIISNRQVEWEGKKLPVPEALETIDLLSPGKKVKLWGKIIKEIRQVGEIAEHEINAIITDSLGEDELRGYKKPYSDTLLAYEDSEAAVENLVKAVSTEGFRLSREFYKIKAEYHKVKRLPYALKYQPIGRELSLSFESAVDICRGVFYGLKNEYGKIFDQMLERGQIDVYPRPGKRGGAFMSAEYGHPTHVFLNHMPNFKSLETLAHEMGHAIHAERSKANSPFYAGFSTTTAETASTLFENLVFDAVYAAANEEDRFVMLHDRITRDIATIERQIAFFNCELEFHQSIKEKGFLQNAELAEIMQKHLESYLGQGVSLSDDDGYSYVYIPHLRYGFYVYTYAFGILMSTIMANRYRQDKSYIDSIDRFLSAGGSSKVADIFKSVGIDTTKPDTFTEALKNHEQDIAEFRKLVRRRSK